MSHTNTVYVSLSKLALRGEEAGTVVRLMMVCNDIASANAGVGTVADAEARADRSVPEHVRWGTKMYFIRLQIGHLNEAMPIIAAIQAAPELANLVTRCSPYSQECFTRLTACLRGGADHQTFKRAIELVRHKTAFHYDAKLVTRALLDRAERAKKPQTVTTSNNMRHTRYGVADAILDTLVVRHVWGIRDAELDAGIEAIIAFGEPLVRSILEFSQEYVTRYVRQHAAI